MSASALTVLDQHGIMALATTRPDGWPQATVVCYVNDGLAIYFLISRKSQKFANIARDPRVSIAIGGEAHLPDEIRGLSMAADVSEVRDEPYRSQVLVKLSHRHPDYFDAATFEMAGSALMRALPHIMSVVDFSRGLGHAEALSVGAEQIANFTAATPNDWGFNPAH
jgi:nitroimidazol reductase NimA-like FMN-containing flavoprotein (pyridoxamine 5'-phosphate oxidase superfamily)